MVKLHNYRIMFQDPSVAQATLDIVPDDQGNLSQIVSGQVLENVPRVARKFSREGLPDENDFRIAAQLVINNALKDEEIGNRITAEQQLDTLRGGTFHAEERRGIKWKVLGIPLVSMAEIMPDE